MHSELYDVVIIGSGAGGGTLAYALRESGARVLVIERGAFIPQESDNWDEVAVMARRKYQHDSERWHRSGAGPLTPLGCYFVGGSTKLYGGALMRRRREDFGVIEHKEGRTVAWPWSYDALEPYYAEAESLYLVHGAAGDPTDPDRSSGFPHPAVPHEPYVVELLDRLRVAGGVTPHSLPLGVDLGEGGTCVRCATCDGFPCKLLAKADTERCCVRPALRHANVTLLSGARALRLITASSGQRVEAVEVEHDGVVRRISAGVFVVSCGAVNSAALLLRSRSERHPRGLANGSDQVGRNLMLKLPSLLIAVDSRINPTVFHKTWGINDYYLRGPGGHPLGMIQSGHHPTAAFCQASVPGLSAAEAAAMAERATIVMIMTESLSSPDNRVRLRDDEAVEIDYTHTNLSPHREAVELAEGLLRKAGFTEVHRVSMLDTPMLPLAHQCGTVRFGTDAATAVLDPDCKAHEVDNLYVVDASFVPSIASANPALTIMANALRVGRHLVTTRLS